MSKELLTQACGGAHSQYSTSEGRRLRVVQASLSYTVLQASLGYLRLSQRERETCMTSVACVLEP